MPTPLLDLGEACTDLTMPFDHADLVVDDNDGVRFVMDLADRYCYASGAAPTNGTPILDLAERAPAGQFVLGSGKSIGFSGNGFDFSTYVQGGGFLPCYADLGSDFAASVWGVGSGATVSVTMSGTSVVDAPIGAGGSGYVNGKAQLVFVGGTGTPATGTVQISNGVAVGTTITNPGNYSSPPTAYIVPSPQYFLVILYLKLPTLANWNSVAAIFAWLQWVAGTGGYPGEADLFTFGMAPNTSPGQFTYRRQTNGAGTVDAIPLTPAAGHYGTIVQIGIYRTAAGQGFQIAGMSGNPVLNTLAVGQPNIGNFGTKSAGLGLRSSFNGGAATPAVGVKAYRAVFSDQLKDVRAPLTTLADDRARFIDRYNQGIYA